MVPNTQGEVMVAFKKKAQLDNLGIEQGWPDIAEGKKLVVKFLITITLGSVHVYSRLSICNVLLHYCYITNKFRNSVFVCLLKRIFIV